MGAQRRSPLDCPSPGGSTLRRKQYLNIPRHDTLRNGCLQYTIYLVCHGGERCIAILVRWCVPTVHDPDVYWYWSALGGKCIRLHCAGDDAYTFCYGEFGFLIWMM